VPINLEILKSIGLLLDIQREEIYLKNQMIKLLPKWVWPKKMDYIQLYVLERVWSKEKLDSQMII